MEIKYNFGGGHLGFQDGPHAKCILLYNSPPGQYRHISSCTYIFGVDEKDEFAEYKLSRMSTI